MKISTYTPTSNLPNTLMFLLKEKYGKSRNFDYFISDLEKSYSFCVGNENINFNTITLEENGLLLGHVAMIVDKRLPLSHAFFGFLEVINKKIAFDILWKNLLVEAKKMGISKLMGPVNGSIWHQYRCISKTDGSDFFKTELPSEKYYYNYLCSGKPTKEIKYYSASREKFGSVLPKIKEGYDNLSAHGFRINELKAIDLMKLQSIATLSKEIFNSSWGYTQLNGHEFMQLYPLQKFEKHLNKLYLLYKNDDIIGYCGTGIENSTTLICKTICIMPKFQGLGLGNALAYRVHVDANKDGYRKIIYALIKEGNNVKNFPKDDAVIFRKYSAFEYNI